MVVVRLINQSVTRDYIFSNDNDVILAESILSFENIVDSKNYKLITFLLPIPKKRNVVNKINFDGTYLSEIKMKNKFKSLSHSIIYIINKYKKKENYIFLINSSGLDWQDISILFNYMIMLKDEVTINFFIPENTFNYLSKDFKEKLKVYDFKEKLNN